MVKRMHWLFIAGLVEFVVFLVIYFTGMDDVPGYGTISGLGLLYISLRETQIGRFYLRNANIRMK